MTQGNAYMLPTKIKMTELTIPLWQGLKDSSCVMVFHTIQSYRYAMLLRHKYPII
uniref:Uncharacterized protein n=1 Tax=Arundo donax TaxID=35708 RepID=A0A0A9BU00_ARUDO